jgi:hypothetical protein
VGGKKIKTNNREWQAIRSGSIPLYLLLAG